MSRARECDVLVVGRGAAGSMASLSLAKRGADVLLIGRDATATALSTGRVDLTGVPSSPEISRLLKRLGEDYGLFQASGRGDRAVTNLGTLARQSLSSAHDWTLQDLRGPVALLGLRGNPDLDPILVAAAMAGEGTAPRCRPYLSPLSLPLSIPVEEAGQLGGPARRAVEEMAGAIAGLDEGTVVIPTLFSGLGYQKALEMLERSAGRQVREAATPLSNPGQRLQRCLEDGAAKEGCVVWRGRELLSLRVEGDRAVEATVGSGLREQRVQPKAVILATGNLVAGGLVAEGRDVVDPLGLFATARWEGPSVRSPGLGSALSTGLKEEDGQAVLRNGTAARNIFVAGSAVPGTSYPLGRGLGHAIADALNKARVVGELI